LVSLFGTTTTVALNICLHGLTCSSPCALANEDTSAKTKMNITFLTLLLTVY
jgi:hypothetical protein